MRTKHFITKMTLIAAITLSCSGQKAVSDENVKTTEMTNSTFDSKGYTAGTIVQSKAEGDCEWTIKLADGRHFESTDMNKDFMVDGLDVWFKYTPQRRMQQCDKASPIAISEILSK